ncbi:MAG: LacI family DNA-binding transcriptional regulator [Hyphomicrobiales bacterium]|nr:LacI family DNA-binding transcriptional regulator [Hyphomicrobiales bacterium]
MPITLKDVAERAGVSRAAVSRTFTEGASVSEKMRKKVEKAARDLGYSPSLIARSLTTKRTKLIGLVANNFQNPVFLDVFDLYTRALQKRELRPLLVNLTSETDPEQSVRMLRQYSVDGVIIATSTLPTNFSRTFRQAHMPVVHAFGRFDPVANVHVVGINNILCGRLAAQTLVDRGYRRIAIIGGPEYATSTQDRIAGFSQRMRELNLNIADVSYAENYTYAAGRNAMDELLGRASVEVVFCGDDLICMGAMDAARSKGRLIPGDIGFLGFNDMDMAGWDAYRLTTIRQPVRDIILSSVELIVELANDGDRLPEVRLFPCSIVERSTLKPPISN